MIKPDDVIMASQLPNYMNIGTDTTSMLVSGVVGAGTTTTFTASLTIARQGSHFDIYALNSTAGYKQLINNTNFLSIYLYSGNGEATSISLTYTATTITFKLFVTNNTGSPITLTAQSFIISSVEYRAPF